MSAHLQNKNILISGAGIAGPTLAFWLKKYGFHPVIVERAAKPREGGYMIDFWGLGFQVAEKMGLIPSLKKVSYQLDEVTFINDQGRRIGGFDMKPLRSLVKDRLIHLLRSDLAKAIYQKTEDDIEYIFDDNLETIDQHQNGVTVTFQKHPPRQFDLVIGADGMHSTVRHLVFGDASQFENYCGYYISAFTIQEIEKANHLFLSYTTPGHQTGLYSLKNHQQTVLFAFAHSRRMHYDYHDQQAQKDLLRNTFHDQKWLVPSLLEKIDTAQDFYFDGITQIIMPHWSKNRVSLVGDAAYCPSPLSGQGAPLAMAGAYVLAGELKAARGDYHQAFAEYEKIFRPLMLQKQKEALQFASSFVPSTPFQLWLRNLGARLMAIPFLSKFLWKKLIYDSLTLKEY